jgi:hypothetical protein
MQNDYYIDHHGYYRNKKNRLIHRIVCRKSHGPFPVKWHVHHINGGKLDNRPENLIALPPWLHRRIHDSVMGTLERLPDRAAIEVMLADCLVFIDEPKPTRKRKRKRDYRKKKPSRIINPYGNLASYLGIA